MPFLYNIPQANDQLSISQGDLLNNFQILGAIAGNATANSASINGTVGFNFINFAVGAGQPATGANQMALYASSISGTQQLYVQKQNSTLPIPMTASNAGVSNPGAGFTGMSQGWTYLPSGALMVWGNSNTQPGGAGQSPNRTINYSSVGGFPGFTVGANIQLTRITSAQAAPPPSADEVINFLYIQASTLNSFTANSSAASTNVFFCWFAIGI